MSEFEMFLCCLLVPLFFVLVYVAGRLNLISWAVRAAADFSSASGKTNADRIRSMTDEALAEVLYSFTSLDDRIAYCQNMPKCDACLESDLDIPGEWCTECLLAWLQQPVKEER